jgi:hypothetical protein
LHALAGDALRVRHLIAQAGAPLTTLLRVEKVHGKGTEAQGDE